MFFAVGCCSVDCNGHRRPRIIDQLTGICDFVDRGFWSDIGLFAIGFMVRQAQDRALNLAPLVWIQTSNRNASYGSARRLTAQTILVGFSSPRKLETPHNLRAGTITITGDRATGVAAPDGSPANLPAVGWFCLRLQVAWLRFLGVQLRKCNSVGIYWYRYLICYALCHVSRTEFSLCEMPAHGKQTHGVYRLRIQVTRAGAISARNVKTCQYHGAGYPKTVRHRQKRATTFKPMT